MAEQTGIVRTPTGVVGVQDWCMGSILTYGGVDPEGVELPSDAMSAVMLKEDIPILPKEHWSRIQKLYLWMLHNDPRAKLVEEFGEKAREKFGRPDANNEVMVCLGLADDKSHWIVGVPRQVVGHAAVAADYTKGVINLETGEEYPYWPPPGYMACGTSHSHNTFGAMFSGTDDRNELGQPGMHLVCGEYRYKDDADWDYRIAPSIVLGGKRYQRVLESDDNGNNVTRAMAFGDLVDTDWVDNVTLPDKVTTEYISVDFPKDWNADAFRCDTGTTALVPVSQTKTYADLPLLPFDFPLGFYRERREILAHNKGQMSKRAFKRLVAKWQKIYDTDTAQKVFGGGDEREWPARHYGVGYPQLEALGAEWDVSDIYLGSMVEREAKRTTAAKTNWGNTEWAKNAVQEELRAMRTAVRYIRTVLGEGPGNIAVAQGLAEVNVYVRGLSQPGQSKTGGPS